MKQFRYMDPEMIMTIVISLIILAIGVYAFFIVTTQATTAVEATASGSELSMVKMAINNTSATGNSVFNIVGIVLIIGAIMSIIGLVYSYMRPKY